MQKRTKCSNHNKGFTLPELIVVIVILGVITKYAVARYNNLVTYARTNSTQSLAAALASASANNFAARTASGGTSVGSAIANCTAIGALLPSGALPTGYTIASLSIAAASAATCTVTGTNNTTATFRGLGIT